MLQPFSLLSLQLLQNQTRNLTTARMQYVKISRYTDANDVVLPFSLPMSTKVRAGELIGACVWSGNGSSPFHPFLPFHSLLLLKP